MLSRVTAGRTSQREAKLRRDNTDQGSQFTGAAFTGVLADNGIAISMDGKGAWRDNVFREALEKRQIRGGLSASLRNRPRRPHSSLDDRTPDQAYIDLPPLRAAA